MSVEGSRSIGQHIKDIWDTQVSCRLRKRAPEETIIARPEDAYYDLIAEEETQVLRESDRPDKTK
ncbi:MAG TPA: hypothetical protein VMR19_02395 [Candidatus Saccharimonadales bacterium]|jgi:hypothetical protein|nr:hypothetical protein [Candidatus Saccharimonadales bacterium]